MNLLDIVAYFTLAGLGAAVNAVAGGGTFLVFPLLILNGLSSLQANIMSTVALWPGSVASSVAFRGERRGNGYKQLKPMIIASIIGSALGTALLLSTPEQTFAALVPWLLLAAVMIFTFPPPLRGRVRVGGTPADHISRDTPPTSLLPLKGGGGIAFFLQFFIAIYGGYFGAGIGILMLAMLQLLGFSNIHQMNALKTVLGSAINAVAWAVFVCSGRVVWDIALVMIAGAITGGFFGARLSLRVAPEKVRALVSAIGFAMTAYFFFK